MVGATRFEHATSWSQTTRSTKLNYAPKKGHRRGLSPHISTFPDESAVAFYLN